MTTTVLLHPIGLDARCWRFVDLPNALALDFPGHGDWPMWQHVGLLSLADYVCGRVEGRFHLVGLSLGGMVAQHVALRHPDRLASLLVACASAAASREVLIGRAQDVERFGLDGVADDYLERWFTPEALAVPDHPGVAYARSTLTATRPDVVAAYWRAMAEHDAVAALGRLAVPTTVVAGARDTSAPVQRMRDLAGRIPGARLIIVDGPHMLPLETPDRLRAAIVEHVEYADAVAGQQAGSED